jgi:amidohydrolase
VTRDSERAKADVLARVRADENELIATSRRIHSRPELQYQEHETAATLCELVSSAPGVIVEQGIGELPTAFRATRQGAMDGPRIAFVAEYDALPDIGHGCGHNIIGTAAVGALRAAAPVVEELGGTVEVIGTPAEEGGGGKVHMVNRGVFDDVDIAIMMHPSWATYVCPPLNGMASLRFAFSGLSSHAGQAPHLGRSALAAVIQTFNGVDAMRQFVHHESRIHGVITEGGSKPSVIPDRASCHFFVRAPTKSYMDELAERVRNCARGAALSTGTTVSFPDPDFPAYEPFVPSPTISDLYRGCAASLGHVAVQLEESRVYASNDIGNVSRRLPAAMMMFGITGGAKIGHHSREFAQAAISPAGDRALVDSAAAMALTAMQLLAEPQRVRAAQEELPALLRES